MFNMLFRAYSIDCEWEKQLIASSTGDQFAIEDASRRSKQSVSGFGA
jgi:hypothetical protein